MNIFFSKDKAKYITLEMNEICSKCEAILTKFCFLKSKWFIKRRNQKRPMQDVYYCLKCAKNLHKDFPADYETLKIIVLIDKLPSDAIPVFKRPPKTQVGAVDNVFDLADNDRVPVEKDYTKLSGRTESIQGAIVGNPDMDLLQEKDKNISEKDGLDFLDNLLAESKQISEKKLKELEEK